MTEQWDIVYVGGDQMSSTLLVHRACGAFIANRLRHEQVCTAPDWEPTKAPIGETHDWVNP